MWQKRNLKENKTLQIDHPMLLQLCFVWRYGYRGGVAQGLAAGAFCDQHNIESCLFFVNGELLLLFLNNKYSTATTCFSRFLSL